MADYEAYDAQLLAPGSQVHVRHTEGPLQAEELMVSWYAQRVTRFL